jgi:hypothetical protein
MEKINLKAEESSRRIKIRQSIRKLLDRQRKLIESGLTVHMFL